MGRYDGILLMSDFDGTLSHRGGVISKENCEAIKYFEKEGGIFSVASGRWGEYVAELRKQVPFSGYAVALNGTVIFDPKTKRNILLQPFDTEKMIEFIKAISKECPKRDHIRFHEEVEKYRIYPDDDIDAAVRSRKGPFYKFLCITPTENSDEYFEKIKRLAGDDFCISRSWVNGIEVQPAGTSKGDAIARLRELYGGRVHTVVAVGDYENDVDMIKKADIGYAVANAVNAVLEIADRVTVGCDENAIAAIINEL